MANTINIGNIEASAIMIGSSAVSAVYIGSDKIYPSGPPEYSRQYLTFEVVEPGTVTIKTSYSPNAKTIQYSLDNGSNWTSLTTSTTEQSLGGTLSAGDKVLVKGTNSAYGSSGAISNNFGGTAKVNVYGNIMSLINGDNFASLKTLSANFTFHYLFSQYANLLSAENLVLPATTLTENCYFSMFQGCTSLTTAPALPATTLAVYCYYTMFQGCTNLTTVPSVLPATTLAEQCYYNMFSGCTSLVNAPALPATTLANNCYFSMFNGCTSLTSAPALPATTLASSCYSNMFSGCTSLVNAPALPATTLANNCYTEMFRNCTNLTTAPELPATTLVNSCYYNMFYNCTSLNYIKCLATDISASGCTTNWVFRVASTGTFVKDVSMSNWTTGIRGIPSGWTVENYGTVDNWLLVDSLGMESPRKIKVDYSLIVDTKDFQEDYVFNANDLSSSYLILYLNDPTATLLVENYGIDYDFIMELFEKVVVFDSNNGAITDVLEDGVEYSAINNVSLTDFSIGVLNSNRYLYATL